MKSEDKKTIGWVSACALIATFSVAWLETGDIKRVGLYVLGWVCAFGLLLVISGSPMSKN